jgi:hypothetical protein
MADLITNDIVHPNSISVVLQQVRCGQSGYFAGNEATWSITNRVVGFSFTENSFCVIVSILKGGRKKRKAYLLMMRILDNTVRRQSSHLYNVRLLVSRCVMYVAYEMSHRVPREGLHRPESSQDNRVQL